MHVVLADSVRFLLKCIRGCDPAELYIMLRLVRERKELIEGELRFERLLSPDILPPNLANLYSLDFLAEESEVVPVYRSLLEQLDDAEQGILAKIGDQNEDAQASDL